MARYCFYCNRELVPGERCQCQQTQHHSTESHFHSEPVKQPLPRRASTLLDQLRTLLPAIGQTLLACTQYFIRPATKIRQESVRPMRIAPFLFLPLFVFMTGLTGTLMMNTSSTIFSRIMISTIGKADINALNRNNKAAFAFFSFSSLIWIFLLTLCFRMFCSVMRKKITYRRLLYLLCISLIYAISAELLLLLSMQLGNAGALTISVAGISIVIFTNSLSIRNSLGLSENSAIWATAFSYVISASFFRVAFPEIAHFFATRL